MKKLLIILFFVLSVFSISQAADLIQENEKGEFSAHLNNVSLQELIGAIENKYNIKFKGVDTQLQTPITISFEKLSLEQMLKKILSRINFVFTYNMAGKVTEVTLLQTSDKKTGTASNQNNFKSKESPAPVQLAPEALKTGNTTANTMSIFPNNTNSAPDNITSFKVVPNAPPPGAEQGKIQSDGPDEITSFKIIPNAPPPGN